MIALESEARFCIVKNIFFNEPTAHLPKVMTSYNPVERGGTKVCYYSPLVLPKCCICQKHCKQILNIFVTV